MSLLQNIHIGHSGLTAAGAALNATSHNVSNAATPGYSRRILQQNTAIPVTTGIGVAGRGTRIVGFARQGSDLITDQQVSAEGSLSRSSARQSALAPLEALMDETQLTGPHLALSEFYDALQTATQDPGDPSIRRTVATKGKALARAMRQTADGIAFASDTQREVMAEGVGRLNQVAKNLAEVNRDIVATGGQADLLDERDRLLKEAGALAGAEADFQADGTANLIIGGHAMVSGTSARSVSVQNGDTVVLDVGKGAVELEGALGGELAGINDAIDYADSLYAQMDTTVQGLADALNVAHQAGFDRSGTAGGDLFTYDPGDPAGSLRFSDAIDADPDLLAFAGDPTALIGDGDNIATLVDVEKAQLFGTRTAGEVFTAMTSSLAATVDDSRAEAEHSAAILQDLDTLQANLSGVDLDEEAANLILYQTAYQASAKVVQVNDELLNTLMEIV